MSKKLDFLPLRTNRAAVANLLAEISSDLEQIPATAKPLRIMEVCGTHTMAIHRYGIKSLLPPELHLLSGPGCPVCVTGGAYLDAAITLAEQGVKILSFGDLLKVPSQRGDSLLAARGRGADIEVCVSVFDALERAQAEPLRSMVFLAVGFETTLAPIVLLIETVVKAGLRNLSFLCDFKRVLPALVALSAEAKIDAFLCPGHVSAIIGANAYQDFVEKHHLPCVVAGFEPLDIIQAVQTLVRLKRKGEAKLLNLYGRVVRSMGNQRALALFAKYLRPVDAYWRGIGFILQSGFGLCEELADYDAQKRFSLTIEHCLEQETTCVSCTTDEVNCAVEGGNNLQENNLQENNLQENSRPENGQGKARAICGLVLRGLKTPLECPLFGNACTPERPIGPLMVSSEGSCAAFFRYG